MIQWHVDAVTELPAGAVHLASSPGCENQAFRLGRLAWGIQFHIETTPATVRRWAAEDAAALAGYDLDAILARSDAAHDDIAEVWRPFAAAFARVVADPGVGPGGPAAADLDRGTGHRSGGDPRGAGRGGGLCPVARARLGAARRCPCARRP